MNKNQILLEINAAIAAMLDSNWSYFSAPSYMRGFFADGIIRCLLYDDFLWPHIHMLVCNAYVWALVVRIYMRVWEENGHILRKKNPQSRKDRKYTWQKTARISYHNFETKGRLWTRTRSRAIRLFSWLWSHDQLSVNTKTVRFLEILLAQAERAY